MEYAHELLKPEDRSSASLFGTLQNMLPAQIAKQYDFRGPALKVNTACSSGLYAIHLACQSIRTGEVEGAIVGGVQLNLTDSSFKAFDAAGLLKQGQPSTPFANGPSGLVPGEGGSAFVLKTVAKAREDGDQILSVIRKTTVNNDGPSLSGSAPNPRGQIDLLKSSYRSLGLKMSDLSYFEAHAAGTAIGDGIEVHGIQSALNEMEDAPTKKIPLGSSKDVLAIPCPVPA